MNFTIATIALALAAGFGGWGGYKATRAHYEHVIDVAGRKAQAAVDAANQKAENAASDWEVWASLQRPKTITVTREVEREVKADVDCSARPLPAGLRDALTRAGSAADSGIADSPVPAASAAGLGDLWRRGAGLLGGTGGTSGLPSEAPSPR